MSISSLSNRPSPISLPKNDMPSPVAGPPSPGIQAGGCAPKGEHGGLSDMFKDGFGGMEKGGGLEKLLDSAKELMQTINQLKDLLQGGDVQDLGAESPVGGAEAAGGAGGAGGSGGGEAAGGAGGAGGSGGAEAAGGAGGAGGVAGAGEAPQGQVGDWIKEAQKALAAAGIPADKMNAQDIARIIEHESSGNPNAINNWDSNAQQGTPSIGLMQTIQPTFDANKLPGHDDIRNPVDNIIAGVRYAVERYGSVSNVPGIQGLNQGGSYVGY